MGFPQLLCSGYILMVTFLYLTGNTTSSKRVKQICQIKNEKKGEVANLAEEKLIGKVSHYFTKISVGIIELEDTIKVGDTIHIKGATTDFTQQVESMQIEHESINEAKAGQSIGLEVNEPVRENDKVYKVIE